MQEKSLKCTITPNLHMLPGSLIRVFLVVVTETKVILADNIMQVLAFTAALHLMSPTT